MHVIENQSPPEEIISQAHLKLFAYWHEPGRQESITSLRLH